MNKFALTLLALTSVAQAHVFYIEPVAGGRANVHHAEYEEGFRAEKIKKWENYAGLKAWSRDKSGKAAALELRKEDGYFSVPFADGTKSVWASNTERGVADWRKYGEGISRPFNYVRYVASLADAPSKPEMDLEILPVKGKAGAFRVYFKGQPTENVKVTVFAPNFWSQEKYSDKDGLIQAAMPWPGTYVLAVHHFVETKDGIFNGAPYEFERHTSTLCVKLGQE